MNRAHVHKSDFLIIGGGISGLVFALKIADLGKTTVVVKTKVNHGNSLMAQGGIAAAISDGDSFEKHIEDTLYAGAGLCRKDIVEKVISQGPDRIEDLINYGVNFDLESNKEFSLHKEGGHSQRRILHVNDLTGKAIHDQLLAKVLAHPNIEIVEEHMAIDLITRKSIDPNYFDQDVCLGAYVLDKNIERVTTFLSKSTVLATGGAGKVYLYTSNWSGATGDGIAMSYRAGCRVSNLEFIKFHPTCLFHPHSRNFLISEALRGEGAQLINSKGESFMNNYHPMGSLAPRDIVARSIDAEMKTSGDDHVFLDATHLTKQFLQSHFPAIFQRCLELSIDISEQPIPVVPAAHYLCGGVLTDINGRTDLDGLFALGETACTGLHGANRLASNSLLECVVFPHNAANYLRNNLERFKVYSDKISPWNYRKSTDEDELIVISHMWDEIRRLMWNYVGIVRTNRRLRRAQSRLRNISSEFVEYYSNFRINSDIAELRNIALVADLTVECALRRHESRGIHYNLDFPVALKHSAHPQDTILDKNSAYNFANS